MSQSASLDLARVGLTDLMLSGEPFTYGQMCGTAHSEFGIDETKIRIVDPLIQKLRRKGLISFSRPDGARAPEWKATAEGRLEHKRISQ